MKKRLVALLLAVLFVVSLAALAGCNTGGGDPVVDPTKAATGGDTGDDTGDDTKTGDDVVKGDPVHLIWLMGYSTIPAEYKMVEEELNKLSLEAVNATMETLYVDGDACKLHMTSGEAWDMAFTCEWYNDFATQSHAGYFADLQGLVQTETPKLWASMPEDAWMGGFVGDHIYAIPVFKDYAAMHYWRFDKALFVDELNMDYTKADDWYKIEEFLAAAKEARPNDDPMILNGGGPSMDVEFDFINRDAAIGLSYSALGTADANKVVSIWYHDDFLNKLRTIHTWFKAGYINKDAAVRTDQVTYSAVKSGQGFYGADAIWTAADNFEQVIQMHAGPFLSTSSVRGALNGINAELEADRIIAALKYQEYINTNRTYRDMLRYGIEGTHFEYVTDDNGDQVVQVLERGTNSYTPWPFSQATYVDCTVTAPSPADMWDHVKADMATAVKTEAMGFTFDKEPVQNELAAVKTVLDKYNKDLRTGTNDPDAALAGIQSELEAAGLQKVIDEAQTQLDAFLAS